MRQFIFDRWFDLLQSVGILAGLLFTAYSIRVGVKTQRVTNLFQITQFHREIWSLVLEKPELQRIPNRDVDLNAQPLKPEERLFVSLLILHLGSTFEAMKARAITPIHGMERDVKTFFKLPIPAHVWQSVREYQNADFVKFVDQVTAGNSTVTVNEVTSEAHQPSA